MVAEDHGARESVEGSSTHEGPSATSTTLPLFLEKGYRFSKSAPQPEIGLVSLRSATLRTRRRAEERVRSLLQSKAPVLVLPVINLELFIGREFVHQPEV